ncbi:MAG TPA: SGNH/GDSL hydrolase family protein [Blastocatellia bacterium]|nr:SGNH/GDSL hydrolase family protein [Blastocatellia bacterium]HMV85206.1 SGNH/GDSL hydrolase family protein [Blastocatellia bacterium]HMX24588.1 SGNH/GDSL hydrolase family protein [Blastocatellia bacterium]HMY72290.1 SGNH/GDSL hydrolase family protein [Blastocatellia bacterium]HMZ22689.1 SGNH/GDSL hydrolase family protein [Blastocatellia bacterium]
MKSLLFKLICGGCALLGLAAAAVQKSPGCAETLAALEQRAEMQRQLLWDWAGLIRYGSENTELRKPKPEENRVVFLGDEITENWPAENFFSGKPYFNRGITGQTSAQMLVRFRQDVIKLKPKVVVIAAGTNDVASIHSPITQQMSAENITSMVELAKANNIKVVLAAVTPICDCYTKRSLLRPFGKIIGLNNWLEEYATASGSVYLNYYAALGEGRNLKKQFTSDGVLLNEAAYAVMAPLAETAIAQALAK